MSDAGEVCGECLRRRWLLETLAPRLERERSRIDGLLEVSDRELIDLVGGAARAELLAAYGRFDSGDARRARESAVGHGLELICSHWDGFPERLRSLAAPAAVLSVNGGGERLAQLCAGEVVSIVGTRRPTTGGTDAARAMARALVTAGVTVVSGLAFGIDSAAHSGALEGGNRTVAVLPCSAARPYPASRARLFDRLLDRGGVVVGELSLTTVWRWALQARNRLIAGLADITVLIEAPERSGALITVRHADALRRRIATVPGAVTSPQSGGPNRLLAKARAGTTSVDRANVTAVRDAQDVLDLLYGEGIVNVSDSLRPPLIPAEAGLLRRIQAGLTSVTMVDPAELVALSGLELKGWAARGPGGEVRVISD